MNDEVDANQERSRRLYEEVFGQGHYAVADDLMAADTINHGPGSPPVLGTDGIKRQAAQLRTAIPDRFTFWQQLGLLPASPERTAEAEDPGAAGEHREASPAAYAGEAALPAVTDQMLRDALQRVRRYTVCILKAAPLYAEPGADPR